LLSNLLRVDRVPAPLAESSEPGFDFVLAMIGTRQTLCHDSHEARDVSRDCVALSPDAVSLERRAHVRLPALHSRMPAAAGKRFSLRPA
jgi:hypothetical protein